MSTLSERLIAAFQANPSIATTREDVDGHRGCTLEEMEAAGLTKADLKKLERQGLAIRAKTQNGGLLRKEDGTYSNVGRFGPGQQNRWFILIPTPKEEPDSLEQG